MTSHRVVFAWTYFCVITGMMTLMPSLVLAHNTNMAITEILFNDRSGNVEVIHRFSLHDVDHAADVLLPPQDNTETDQQRRKRFAAYVADSFSLQNLSENALSLSIVGSEVDGTFLWVYQEVAIPKELAGLIVQYGARKGLRSQQNILVNIKRNEQIRSLRFRGGDGPQRIRFDD